MKSHFLHLLLYSFLVATFFAVLVRDLTRDRLRLGAILWLAMVGGTLALYYPLDGTLFPPDIAAPTLRWQAGGGGLNLHRLG